MTSTTVSHDIVSFFVCSIEKHIVCCISAKKNYYNLTKNSHKFRASVIEMCTSVSKSSGVFWQNSSKPPVKKLNLEKNFTAHELVHKWFLRFLVSFFSHIYRSITYDRHILYSYYVCKRHFSHLYYSWSGKRKKKSFCFWITFACCSVWSIYLILQYSSINIFNYFLHFLK